MPRKGPMSEAEKKAFLKRMEEGKKKKAAQKMGASRRRKPARRRTKNPGTLSKINWTDTAKTFGGVAGGAFLGYAITDFIGDLLISKLPAGAVQGIGYALGGAGVIIAGHLLQKELKDWPITAASAAIAAPFALRSFAAFDFAPLGVESETMSGMGFFGRRRRTRSPRTCLRVPMGGSFARNPMQGSFARNPMSGSMIAQSPFRGGMSGTFLPEARVPMRTRGGHGPVL